MRSSLQEVEELDHAETEITLGMKSLLGVFFGLVLICGVFFGLGYSLGHGSARPSFPAPAASTPATRPLATGPVVHENDGSEPSTYLPGPDAHEPVTPSAAETRASSQSAPSEVKQLTPSSEGKPATASPKPTPAVATSETETPTAKPASASLAAAPASTQASATATPGTPSMVQIAAVSRQEDAEILVAALKKHGYNAVIRNDPRDSLLHVQIGPFSTRDEARTMRAKLLADGYNAILK